MTKTGTYFWSILVVMFHALLWHSPPLAMGQKADKGESVGHMVIVPAGVTVHFDSDFKYPDYADKIVYAGRDVEVLALQFAASKPPLFKLLAWLPGDAKRVEVITEIGKKFGGLRSFTVLRHSESKGLGSNGQPIDRSDLEIREEETGKHFNLVKGIETLLPVYFARLSNVNKPEAPVLRIKEDSSFDLLVGTTGKTKLISVQEDRVRLRCEEKEFDLLKDVAGAENLRIHGGFAGEKAGQVVGPVSIHADVPKGLALKRSGELPPFPRGIPSNITYSLTLEQLKKIGITAGPKCVAE